MSTPEHELLKKQQQILQENHTETEYKPIQLTKFEQKLGVHKENVDLAEVYKQGQKNDMQDTVSLGRTTFKNKTPQQKLRNKRIRDAKKLTTDATAYTLEIHTQLNELKSVEQPENEIMLHRLEQFPFSSKMFLTSKIRSNFKTYISLVQYYEKLRADENTDKARLDALSPVMTLLSNRLRAYCEQNRITMDGRVMSKKDTAYQLDRNDIDNWFEVVKERQSKDDRDDYNPGDVTLNAGQLKRLLDEKGIPDSDELPVSPEKMTAQQRVENIQLIRQNYINAQKARKDAANSPDSDEYKQLLHAELQLKSYFVLAYQEATAAQKKLEGNDAEANELLESAKETYADIKRIEKRNIKREMGREVVQHGQLRNVITRTRNQAISTPSDILSMKSREELSKLNKELSSVPGMEMVTQAIDEYIKGTRYAVGYTKETENLKKAISAVNGAPSNEVIKKISAYFEKMTNGTLDTDGAEIKDYFATRPIESGTGSGSTRNSIITKASKWVDMQNTPLFSHEPTINDLKQHLVSNCYMVASVAGVVNMNPSLIKECIKDNGDGSVTVRLFEYVPVEEKKNDTKQSDDDDDFDLEFEAEEITKYELKPIYVRVKKEIPRIAGADTLSAGALWMQMIEKACAMVGRKVGAQTKTGYMSLWYGEGGEFLSRLFGVEPEIVNDRSEKLFNDILAAGKNGIVYNAATSKDYGSADGLNAGHAYTVMGAKEENGQRYILMRNPYSTYSLNYDEEGKISRTGTMLEVHSDETYGQFYIKFEEFIEKYEKITYTDLSRVSQNK